MTANVGELSRVAALPGEVCRPAFVDEAVGIIGSHPAKILTLAALAQVPPGDSATSNEIVDIVSAATSEGAPTTLGEGDASTVRSYARSLALGGYVTETVKEKDRGTRGARQTATSFAITAKGIEGLTPAAAIAGWEARHDNTSARELLGSVRLRPGEGMASSGPLLRLAILQQVFQGGASLSELKGATSALSEFHVRRLVDAQIITALSKSNPAHRRLRVIPPDLRNMGAFAGNMSAEVRVLYIAAARLAARNVAELSGDELMREVAAADRTKNITQVWQSLLGHQPKCLEFTDAELFGARAFRTRYRIAPAFQPAVADLLETIRALKEEPGAWDEAQGRSLHLLDATNAGQVALLLHKAYRKSAAEVSGDSKQPTADIIAGAIPAKGISERELLARVSAQRTISLATLRNHMQRNSSVLVEKVPVGDASRRRINWVSAWDRNFGPDWRSEASCATGRLGARNPELYFPIGAAGLSAVQREQVKQLCRTCPVRPACLATAVEQGEANGVWGGFDEEERRHLPERVRGLLKLVTIN